MANYVFNSSPSGERYNAKCLNVSDDSEWTPSAAEYPQDGTIDLSGGTSGRYLDTQWEAPQDEEWTMSGIYNVVMGSSYDMYSIHYKTGNLCDIYLGSNTEDLVLSEEDKPYTPPTGTWKIYEEPPAIIDPGPVLGEELYSGVMIGAGGNAVTTDLGNGDWNISQGSASDINQIGFYFTVRTENPVLITFNATLTIPTIIFRQLRTDAETIDIDYVVVEGANELTVAGTHASFEYYYFYSNSWDTSGQPFDVDFRDVSVKAILG